MAEPPAATDAAAAPAAPAPEPPAPVRFFFETDGDGRFPPSCRASSPTPSAPLRRRPVGETFAALAERLGLDPEGTVAAALAGPASLSGLAVTWPLADTAERITVTLDLLPATPARPRARRPSRLRDDRPGFAASGYHAPAACAGDDRRLRGGDSPAGGGARPRRLVGDAPG